MARRGAKPEPPQPRQSRALVASAAPVDITSKGQVDRIAKHRQNWQEEAWAFHDALGEVGDTLAYRANVISKVRLFAAILPEEGDEDPVPVSAAANPGLDEDDQPLPPLLTDQQARQADDTMARLGNGDGVPSLLRKMTLNLDVSGECHVIGEGEGGSERWGVYSDGEMVTKSGKVSIVEFPGDKKGRPVDSAAMVFRVWQPHPRWSVQAHSPMRPIIEEGTAEELLLISREMRSGSKSRIGKGLLVLSEDLDFSKPTPEHDETELDADARPPSVQEVIVAAMTEPIANEGLASEVAPITFTAPAEDIRNNAVAQKIDLGQAIDPAVLERARYLLDRIANALPMPREVTLGMGEVNHWGSWQIERAAFRNYLEPSVLAICNAFTVGFLRPLLLAEKWEPDLAERMVVWYDPSDALSPEDRIDDATKGLELGVLGDKAWRRVARFDESDKPTDDERLMRLGTQRSIMTADLSLEVLKLMFEQMRDTTLPSGPTGSGPAAIDAPSTEEPPRQGPPPDDQPPGPLTASGSRGDLGDRLAEIDRRLTDRVLVAADVAVERAMERAGNRIRSLANRDPRARDAVASLQPGDVAAALGRAWVVRLAATEDDDAAVEALLVGAFASLTERFDQLVASAQAAALAEVQSIEALSPAEVAQFEAVQATDRQRGTDLLVGTLTALTVARLFDPSPTAPVIGEADATVSVPANLVREAVAVAGGAENIEHTATGGLAIDGRPVGGVATGERSRALFARVRAWWTGYRWHYGDASSRTQPFEPHRRLSGQVFTTWEAPELANQTDGWLGSLTYRPGDHAGCRCDFVPIVVVQEQEQAA